MNLRNIDKYWHLLEAAKAGKTIEVFSRTWGWQTAETADFSESPEQYRVKPERATRPWRVTDKLPWVGALVDVWTSDQSKPSLVLGVEYAGLVVASGTSLRVLPWSELFSDGKWSRDGGVAWGPCAITEEVVAP